MPESWRLKTSPEDRGKRLDQFLRERLSQFSRSRLQTWIEQGRVQVGGVPGKRSLLLKGAENIEVESAELPPLSAVAEDLPLEILYEDADLIAVNKPAGMVVHSGAGVNSGTLTNALVHRFETLSSVAGDARPGIVHRLDRYTSGVILVARSDAAHRNLSSQFSSRKIEKVYLALVHGQLKPDQGRITKPIARDPVRRTRMTTKVAAGRSAVTDYRVLRRFDRFTYVEVKIGTGRTHQIRVHMASIGHPVAGDKLYGAPASGLSRYFLHAHRIAFTSPTTGERIAVEAPLPEELGRHLQEIAVAAAKTRI